MEGFHGRTTGQDLERESPFQSPRVAAGSAFDRHGVLPMDHSLGVTRDDRLAPRDGSLFSLRGFQAAEDLFCKPLIVLLLQCHQNKPPNTMVAADTSAPTRNVRETKRTVTS